MKFFYKFYILLLIFFLVFTIQIHSTHLLFTWGANSSGQLGDGTTTAKSSPVLIGSDVNWVKIFNCLNILFAIKSNGTLWGCGTNNWGALGDGTTTNRTTLTQIGTDTNWSVVSTNGSFTLALKMNGTLWAWGINTYGNLGDSTTTTRLSPIKVGIDSNWEYIRVGALYSLAIKSDGSLWGWGNNYYWALDSGYNARRFQNPIPFRIGSFASWQKVSSSFGPNDDNNTLAITNDGYLWGWGWNYYGALAHSTNTSYWNPVRIDSTMTWNDVIVGLSYTLAIRSDGSLWACGWNFYGALGDGTTTDRDSLVRIGTDTNWIKVFAGPSSYGLKRNGSLWAWGNGGHVTIDGTNYTYGNTPMQITRLTRIVEFSSNGNCAAIIDVLPPILRVNSFTNIDRNTAIAHYHIDTLSTPALLTTTNTIKRGICWDTLPNPDTSKAHITYTGNFTTGSYTDSLTGLLMGRTYHVRAYATTVAGTGYSQDTTFTTKSYQLIPLQQGWNMISTYINPDTTDFWVLCQPISQQVVVGKNSAGQFYVPSLGINYIYNWQYNQAYQFYMSAVDTLRIDGPKFVPDSTPIYLSPGWGMISYLRNSPMAIDSALSSISSSFLIVKNGTGQFYIPSMYINTIGNMLPGQGYQIYMLENGVLYYPRNW